MNYLKKRDYSNYNYILDYLSFRQCTNLSATVQNPNNVILGLCNAICIYTILFHTIYPQVGCFIQYGCHMELPVV